MSNYLVLSANPYDFENSQGERISGVKLSYIDSVASVRGRDMGHPPTVMSVDLSFMSKLEGNVPGIFELDFGQVAIPGKKPNLILKDVRAVSPVDIASLF